MINFYPPAILLHPPLFFRLPRVVCIDPPVLFLSIHESFSFSGHFPTPNDRRPATVPRIALLSFPIIRESFPVLNSFLCPFFLGNLILYSLFLILYFFSRLIVFFPPENLKPITINPAIMGRTGIKMPTLVSFCLFFDWILTLPRKILAVRIASPFWLNLSGFWRELMLPRSYGCRETRTLTPEKENSSCDDVLNCKIAFSYCNFLSIIIFQVPFDEDTTEEWNEELQQAHGPPRSSVPRDIVNVAMQTVKSVPHLLQQTKPIVSVKRKPSIVFLCEVKKKNPKELEGSGANKEKQGVRSSLIGIMKNFRIQMSWNLSIFWRREWALLKRILERKRGKKERKKRRYPSW